jgi:hypothetical protein
MPSLHGTDNDVPPKGFGVLGASNNNGGAGVRGDSPNGVGVDGISDSSAGVHGESNTGFGVAGVSDSNEGVHGESNTAEGVNGESTSGDGVAGESVDGIGGHFGGGLAPLSLDPSQTPGPPQTGDHNMGEFFVDSNGVLYFCVQSGTAGTAIWKTVQLV